MIIYKVTNLINNKIYIGQTINTLEYRKDQHFREARCKRRNTVYFHNALNKYGCDNFLFEEIDSAKTQDELNEKEMYWIEFYDSTNKEKGYNLDSGGKNGGFKSEETKRKIGQTTILKWKNPETAAKMREGLRKGAETMKRNAKLYPFTCPICGETYYYQKHVSDKKKYCSLKCAGKGGAWEAGISASLIKNHQNNINKKQVIKDEIISWVCSNPDIVIHCPYNKISTTLTELHELIIKEYNLKDWHSIFICFEVKNRKELLDKLKDIAYISKENVC